MPKRPAPSRFHRILVPLFEKTPRDFPAIRRWAIMAFPGAVVWAYRAFVVSIPGRSWGAGTVVILAATAWYARCLSQPLVFGILTGLGLAVASTAAPAWAVGQSAWAAWLIFFSASIGTSLLQDGRLVLALWTVLWVAASGTLPSVWWVAALFAVFPPPVRLGRTWARWGGAAVALSLMLLSAAKGGGGTTFLGWFVGLQEWFVARGYLVPILLTWLGVSFVERRSFLPWWVAQVAGWTLAWGWMGFQGVSWLSPESMGLLWLAGTGFGLASLRRDLLDPAWHAEWVWLSLALVLWASF